jgi:hypothetical protein
MCGICKKAAVVVGEKASLTAEQVMDVVRTFRAVSTEIEGEEMQAQINSLIDGNRVASEEVTVIETAPVDTGVIPSGLLNALVAIAGGPVLVVASAPSQDGGSPTVHVKCAGSPDLSGAGIALAKVALETLESPVAATGGVLENGRIVGRFDT